MQYTIIFAVALQFIFKGMIFLEDGVKNYFKSNSANKKAFDQSRAQPIQLYEFSPICLYRIVPQSLMNFRNDVKNYTESPNFCFVLHYNKLRGHPHMISDFWVGR